MILEVPQSFHDARVITDFVQPLLTALSLIDPVPTKDCLIEMFSPWLEAVKH